MYTMQLLQVLFEGESCVVHAFSAFHFTCCHQVFVHTALIRQLYAYPSLSLGLLDYDQDAALQIGFIDGSIMSTWEFSIPIFDDIIAEGTEVFTVHLLSSDIGVTTVRDVATIAILDDESKT